MNAIFSCLFKSSLNPTKFNENTLLNLLFIFPETFMTEEPEFLPLSRLESECVEEALAREEAS